MPASGPGPVPLPADAVEVARVQGAWGIRGWVRLRPHSASPEALFSARTWYLVLSTRRTERVSALPEHPRLEVSVRQVRRHGDAVVAALHGVDERNQAEALKGAEVFVARADFPPLDEGEYYWVDLIGLEVHNRQDQALGRVVQLMDTGPQQVLVLHQDVDGQDKPLERLIPFVEAYVDRVDVPGGRIVVDWQPDY